MGLDVYVGTLTRYYTGDWKTVVQQYAESQGIAYQTMRPDEFTLTGRIRNFTDRLRKRRPPSKDEVRSAVIAWRGALSQGLGGDLREPLHWDETDTEPYYTDKPNWDGYGAVLLLAAYDEHPEMTRPATVPRDGWHEDPAWRASTVEGFRTRYRQLLTPDIEFWLPCPFEFAFGASDLLGRPVSFGSSVALLDQLRQLKERAFPSETDATEAWQRDAPDGDAPFGVMARFGLGIMLELAEKSVSHRLPIKLDY